MTSDIITRESGSSYVVDLSEVGPEEHDRFIGTPGEVILVLTTRDELVWLHTKDFYPNGIYRLPTGKLHEGESPDAGFARELHEEAGIAPIPPPECIAHIRYQSGDEVYPFVSYVYRVHDANDSPSPIDESEQITGWRCVPVRELTSVATELRTLPKRWASWGRFRAPAHDVIAEVLRGNSIEDKGRT